MSLTKPKIPLDIKRAFTTELGNFVDPSNPLWSLLSQKFVALEAYNFRLDPFPHKIEDWHLDEKSTSSSGWRFWAAEGDLYGACHVGSVEKDLPPKLTGFADTVQVLTAIEGFNQMSTITELAAAAFEPRVWTITRLPIEAFWLKSTVEGGEDRFVVYSGFPPEGLDLMKSYSWKDFRKEIWADALQARAWALTKKREEQEAQARAADIQAGGAEALRDHAKKQQEKAREAGTLAHNAQEQLQVTRKPADKVQAKFQESADQQQKPAKKKGGRPYQRK